MRTAGWLLLAGMLLATSTGCLIPIYSGDPVRRAQQLIYTSEDLRAISDELSLALLTLVSLTSATSINSRASGA